MIPSVAMLAQVFICRFVSFFAASFRLLVRLLAMFVKIAFSKKALMRHIGQCDKKMQRKKIEMLALAAKRRVAAEALRTLIRKEERPKLRGAKQTKKARVGRPERWPGQCRACCMRWFGCGGGPPHMKSLCEKTGKWLMSGKGK